MKKNILKDSIKTLFTVMNNLQSEFKYYNKKFTLDGRLVGDLGEIVCAKHYNIQLYEKVVPIYDGIEIGTNRKVQIKSTFHDSLTFPCNKNHIPDFYIGIKLYEDGSFEEIYNGKGKIIFDTLLAKRKTTSTGLFTVSIKQLRRLNLTIKAEDKIGKNMISGKIDI